MVHPILIGNAIRNAIKTAKKCRVSLKNESINKEITKLEKESTKWSLAIDTIGRNYPSIGSYTYELEDTVLNNLADIECFKMPYGKSNWIGARDAYFFIDPKYTKEISKESIIKKIHPQPQKAIETIGDIIGFNISKAEDFGYIDDYKKRRTNIINKLTSIRKKIKAPYEPRMNYAPIQEEIAEIAKKMRGVEYDYISEKRKLINQKRIKNAKTITKAAAMIAVGTVIGAKLKKVKALRVTRKTI